jgi:hypothetical protein
MKDNKNISIKKGHNEFTIHVKGSPIVRGKYYIIIGLYESYMRKTHYDHYNGMLKNSFFLVKNEKGVGIVEVPRVWS